ncbi:hypothetical protein PVK06_024732 [Gossypium arboreum]|uniref:Uncharacterized protein n=1 Tax=Gossypium arboreum TaxID=29729 RepID=A0ABR0PEI0_GOSAR|nr:hypothetical protein PVK06_024732 [Gossypium arboreum]
MWEVPSTNFELVPEKGLRKNPKGRPQSSKINNEMDIKEKSNVAGGGLQNMEEKSYALNAIDELELGEMLYYGGYDPGGVE